MQSRAAATGARREGATASVAAVTPTSGALASACSGGHTSAHADAAAPAAAGELPGSCCNATWPSSSSCSTDDGDASPRGVTGASERTCTRNKHAHTCVHECVCKRVCASRMQTIPWTTPTLGYAFAARRSYAFFINHVQAHETLV
eukprot:366266-Chlamydomonas_euryale.AAC.1